MDLNQSESGETKPEASHDAQPQVKPLPPLLKMMEGQKFYMPKFGLPNLKEKFAEYSRVLKVTKKPDSAEFKAIVKASGLGMIIIGIVGFLIAMIVQLTGFA